MPKLITIRVYIASACVLVFMCALWLVHVHTYGRAFSDKEALWIAIAWRKGSAVERFQRKGQFSKAEFHQLAQQAFAKLSSSNDISITFARALRWAPIWHLPILEDFQLVPGHDGLGLGACMLTPHEFFAGGQYTRGLASPIPDLSVGVEIKTATRLLRSTCGSANTPAYRVRFEAWAAVPYPMAKPVNPRALSEAVDEGVNFLLRHQSEDGRYAYIYDAQTDTVVQDGYDKARHAGTALFLAQVALALRDEHPLRAPTLQSIERAWTWLSNNGLRACADQTLCVVEDNGLSYLSPTGLALLLAVARYRLHRSDDRRASVRGLNDWLRKQKRVGSQAHTDLVHMTDPMHTSPSNERWMYASGEGVLALLEAGAALGDSRSVETAVRVLDWLTSKGWSFFGNRYYFGEEHWTCISTGFLVEHLDGLKRYPRVTQQALNFCEHWADYNRAVQYRANETLWQVEGAYGLGNVVPPRITPVGSRTEALIALYRVRPSRALKAQIEKGLGLMLAYQWLPGPIFAIKNAEQARGGFPGSPFELTSRNDFVQHAGSSLLAWSSVLQSVLRF